MSDDNLQSLGDQNTFDGGENQFDPKSLGDEQTFIGNEFDSFDEADDSSFGEREDLSKRYTIEGTLGKGGMGEVLLATDTRLGRKVALKRILRTAARSKKAIDRFITEAKSVAAVKHTNIVDIYDFVLATDGPYLTMEYVEGSSLEEICRKGPLELEEAVSICCQLCDGLARAHSANIIHRDIKPANVLMTPDGIPKLTDFGLAKDDTADAGMTMAGTVLGTLDFMPPEQRKDAALTDSRSDLWSIAATLYQMVAGEPPRVIDLDLVPQQLRASLAQALKSKKEDRYQTAIELRDALRSSLEAPKKAIQTAVLGAGECPECNTQNESSRKFCSECAASLRVSCLRCETEIPIWEKVCGECGGKQQQLLESRIAELDQQKKQAEHLVGEYRFEDALAVAKCISAIEDERFTQYRQWSEEFGQSTKLEWDRQKELAHQHYSNAKKHRKVFDYDAAILEIESIREPFRNANTHNFMEELESDRAESNRLLNEIRSSLKSQDLNNLLLKVERALELRGDRQDLEMLKSQLEKRQEQMRILAFQSQDAYLEAKKIFEDGDARKANRLIRPIQSSYLTPDQNLFKEKIAEIFAAEQVISHMLANAKSAKSIEPANVCEILRAVTAYLRLNPMHKKIAKLKRDLHSRVAKDPQSYARQLPLDVVRDLPSSTLQQLGVTHEEFAQREKVIGIDLGTNNSVIALMEGCEAIVIPNAEGNRLTPSVVAFSDNQGTIVGEPARRQAITNPTRTIYSVKRVMGRLRHEVEDEERMRPYYVEGAANEYVKIKVGDTEHSPQEISANVLRTLKESAESYLGQTVSKAVVAIPAYFNDAQRQATKDAGQIAGLEVVRTITDSTAAALAYGLDKSNDQKILVFNLGGGSFDVSVVEVADSGDEEQECRVFQVISTSGATQLGGDDFDEALIHYVADEFKKENSIDLRQDPMALQRLQEACEKAKKELSSLPETDINLPFITLADNVPKNLTMKVTRAKFEELIDDLVERCRKSVLRALEDAGFSPKEIDETVLVGGSTRVPKVRELVKSIFGKNPHQGVHPDEAVAVGAAIQGSILAGDRTDLLIMDVTPLTLGIETEGGVMTALVPRNTTLPAEKKKVFSTVEDNQTAVTVRVFQGERKMASSNRLLGEFNLEGIPAQPRGAPQIEVKFDINQNDNVSVSAKELKTGKEALTVINPLNMLQTETSRRFNQGEIMEYEDLLDAEEQEPNNQENRQAATP